MATSLAEIRAKLQAQETRSSGNTQSFGDNAIFAHWNIKEGESATIRFLPDADPSNTFFWVERNMIRLPFAGIKGQTDSKPVIVQVPCMEMWGETCPILSEVRPWFKDPSLEEMGRKYWKKRSYLFQGFVRENPIKDDTTPANPIRRFVISTQIFNLVKAALLDPDMDDLPTDYANGIDFRINKTTKGGYADYNTSTWARKTSALTEAEAAAIEQYGLYDLKEFLPKKPGEVELKIIKEMFEASVDGQPYDEQKWGQYFRPNGARASESELEAAVPQAAAAKPAPAAKAAPAPAAEDSPFVEEDDTPAAPLAASTSTSGNRAEDILAMIRNRSKS